MGAISDAAGTRRFKATSFGPPKLERGGLWRNIFGSTDKESGGREQPRRSTVATDTSGRGGWGGSSMQQAAFVRLLNAVRSRAPGGWSDNRWEQANHFTGIVYACVRTICTQLGQTEFQVYKKARDLPDGKRPITEDDPAEREWNVKPYDLVKLLQRPNNRDSWGKLMKRWGQQKWLTGTALTWLVPNAVGVPFEMYSVPTATAIPQPVTNPEFPDGYWRIQPIYPYGSFSSYPSAATSVGALIPAKWMLQFQFPHPLLWYDGYSPLTGMRLHVDEITSIDQGRWYANKGIMNPSAVVNPKSSDGNAAEPLPIEEIERLRSMFENDHQGMDNLGKLLFGSPGYDIEPWGQTPDKMMFESGWDQLSSFIMAGFGTTKPVVGMIEDSSYASLFASLKQFSLQTIQPECDDIAAEITHHIAPFFGDDLIVEIRSSRIDDHDVKNAKLTLLCQNKAIKVNELRKELDMEVTDDPRGDEWVGDEAALPPGAEAGQPMSTEQLKQTADGEPVEPKDEAEQERPTPGPLSEGSLGPRKSIKSFYEQVRKVIANGHHKKQLP